MSDIIVSSTDALQDALDAASGGDTILLAAGSYDDIEITRDYGSTVTLRAIEPGTVRIDDITVERAGHIAIEGVETGQFSASDSHHVTLTDSSVTQMAYIARVSDLVLTGNDITGSYHALILNDVTDFAVTENYIHHAQSDLMRVTGASHRGLIENNTLRDTAGIRPDHPDFLQFFGFDGATPSDITIRGNFFDDDTETGEIYGQGIFLSDPQGGGYRNILIEQNLMHIESPNTIYINGGQENVVVRHNSLIPANGESGAIIQIVDKAGLNNEGTSVYGNVVKEINDETGASYIGDNYVYGRGADVSTLFRGNGDEWWDLVPVAGSAIDFGTEYGAQDRLRALIEARRAALEEDEADEDDGDDGLGDDDDPGDEDDLGDEDGDGEDGDGDVADAPVQRLTRDDIVGSTASDQITGTALDERILGYEGSDLIRGGAGRDVLAGMHQNDTLVGNAGEDVLLGGVGRDILVGGADADLFRFLQNGSAHLDIIDDFAPGEDVLQFRAEAFSGVDGLTAGPLPETAFALGITADGLDGADGSAVRFLYETRGQIGVLRYDPDGTGGAEAQIVAVLRGAPELSAADIELF